MFDDLSHSVIDAAWWVSVKEF